MFTITGTNDLYHTLPISAIALGLGKKRDIKRVGFNYKKMLPQIKLIPGAIAEIMASTSDSRMLTLNDRYGLMAAILDESLDEQEQRAVNRLLRAVLRGRIKVSNQILFDNPQLKI
ncbi:MAG: hypothetical protein AB4352_29770 [Hormoscilla sp.]